VSGGDFDAQRLNRCRAGCAAGASLRWTSQFRNDRGNDRRLTSRGSLRENPAMTFRVLSGSNTVCGERHIRAIRSLLGLRHARLASRKRSNRRSRRGTSAQYSGAEIFGHGPLRPARARRSQTRRSRRGESRHCSPIRRNASRRAGWGCWRRLRRGSHCIAAATRPPGARQPAEPAPRACYAAAKIRRPLRPGAGSGPPGPPPDPSGSRRTRAGQKKCAEPTGSMYNRTARRRKRLLERGVKGL
jgi:hypothetical protein